MQKTLILTFGLRPGVERRERSIILDKVLRVLEDRTLTCFKEGDRITAKHVHRNWDRSHNGSCPENSFWNIFWNTPLGEEVQFLNLTVEYIGALLPSPEPNYAGDFEWRNGESHWVSDFKHRFIPVTCLPSREIVLISMDVESSTEYEAMNAQRQAFLGIKHKVEIQLKTTQAARRLINAFECDRSNNGRIRRFVNKLYMEIAEV